MSKSSSITRQNLLFIFSQFDFLVHPSKSFPKSSNNVPKSFISPEIRIECDEKIKFEIIEKIRELSSKDFKSSEILTIDGIRVTTDSGWWLIRASNTQAALIARAEGFNLEGLNTALKNIDKYLKFSGIKWNVNKYL